MKIKLIAPARKPEWGESFWDLKTLCKLTGRKAGGAPLALPTLAALTPSDVEVVLTDENVEPINFEEKVDLVGITGMTCVIPRSYEIADEYRKRGIPVVMGGIHVSMLPDEAIQHCDSVVIGEAEGIWEQVVKDAQKKKLQKFYNAPKFPDLSNSPIPRWDLLKNDKYCYFTVQTGRGCPYDCDFCSVKEFNGRKYRHKKVIQVKREIEKLLYIDKKKLIFFADDNFLAMSDYAKELIGVLIPLNVRSWMCQASVNKINDDSILELMHKGGCRVIFVGFESVSERSLETMNKDNINKVGQYKQAVDKVHSYKIAVFGSFIFGSDADDENSFKETADFIDRTNIAFSMLNIMTMLPGTRLYERMKSENRLLDFPWWKSNGDWACYMPKSISRDKLQLSHFSVINQIYSYKNLYKRLNNLWLRGIFVNTNKKNIISVARIWFSLLAVINCNFNRLKFIIMGLWHPAKTSLMWVLTGVNFHDFAEYTRKKTYV